jgi:hypothetical protein
MGSNGQKGYSTNLASEFYVLSALHRLGFDANLTLGNKKGVDIVVACGPGRAFTVDVKAVAGKNDWLVGKLGMAEDKHHFVVLVSFEGQFDKPGQSPKVWVYALEDLVPFIRSSKTGTARYISRKDIMERGGKHAENWALLKKAAV